jgi:hypothetical protein
MTTTPPTNNNNNGNNIIIIILEELFNSTSFVNKHRHYYMAILLLHHIQKWKFVLHHNLAMWQAEVTYVIENVFQYMRVYNAIIFLIRTITA